MLQLTLRLEGGFCLGIRITGIIISFLTHHLCDLTVPSLENDAFHFVNFHCS
jgi:hypothetical protein